MAIDPHVHEYELGSRMVAVKILEGGDLEREPVYYAQCKYPGCDHRIGGVEIVKRINSVERFMKMADEAEHQVREQL